MLNLISNKTIAECVINRIDYLNTHDEFVSNVCLEFEDVNIKNYN